MNELVVEMALVLWRELVGSTREHWGDSIEECPSWTMLKG